MTDQPDRPQPSPAPDPAAPPPPASDGTSARPPEPGGSAAISGQPWSTHSGDTLSPEPYRPQPDPPQPYQPPAFAPGHASIPQPPPSPEYPPTSQFPAQPGGGQGYGPPNYGPPGYGPPNYAPPGHAPDYGQNYAPPPPGYGPPPSAPPRKSSLPIVAVIIAVALLLCGGVATAGVLIARRVTDKAKEVTAPINLPTEAPQIPGLPTDLPTDPGTGHTVKVRYEVSGDGPVDIVYVAKSGSPTMHLEDQKLPWSFEAEVTTPTLISVIALRVATSDGSVSCRALVDGAEVKKSTSGTGNFSTAACTYFALD